MTHQWVKTLICEETKKKVDGKVVTIPEVTWFPSCSRCSTQVTKLGKKLLFRTNSSENWSDVEPQCKGQK